LRQTHLREIIFVFMSHLPVGTVTFVFTDVEGSTRLARQLGERWPAVLERHREVLRDAFKSGAEVGTEGDALFYAFSRVEDAIASAVDAQRAVARQEWTDGIGMKVRIGVNTGAAELVGANYAGVEVHRAARVCAAAHGGQTLVSASSAALSRSLPGGVRLLKLGAFQLKDFDDPEALFQVTGDGLQEDFPPPRTRQGRIIALPREVAPLIGRETAVTDVYDLITQCRLVTLTGAGGSGKTRLAIAVAWAVAPYFLDSVVFVPLAPLGRSDQVAGVIADGLGSGSFANWEEVIDAFRDQRALIVLDNAEHLRDLPPLVGQLVERCPRLHVVVTSRSAIGAGGERLYPVEPLSQQDAVELLVDRVRARQPTFAPDDDETGELRRIASRLDGLPLALELAAARLRGIPPRLLADRLDRQLDILRDDRPDVPERQRTVRAAIDWSYQLLGSVEAHLLAVLGVFADAASLQAIAYVAELDELETLDALTRLIDANLVNLVPGRDACYGMLEPVRQYAAELVDDSDAASDIRRRLVAWYRHEVGPGPFAAPDSSEAICRDAANFLRALDYCESSSEWEAWLDLITPVAYAVLDELGVAERVARVSANLAAEAIPERMRARLAAVRVWASLSPIDVDLWSDVASEAKQVGDVEMRRHALAELANSQLAVDAPAMAVATLEEARGLLKRAPSGFDAAWLAMLEAMAADFQGALDTEDAWDRAEVAVRNFGDRAMLINFLGHRAYQNLGLGHHERAQELVSEATRLLANTTNRIRYNLQFEQAVAFLMRDRLSDAAAAMLEALALSEQIRREGRKIPLPMVILGAAAIATANGQGEDALRLEAFARLHLTEAYDTSDRRVVEQLEPFVSTADASVTADVRNEAVPAGMRMDAAQVTQHAIDTLSAILQPIEIPSEPRSPDRIETFESEAQTDRPA